MCWSYEFPPILASVIKSNAPVSVLPAINIAVCNRVFVSALHHHHVMVGEGMLVVRVSRLSLYFLS